MEAPRPAFLKQVDLCCGSNNFTHHTNEISTSELIVRRGLPFTMMIKLGEAFNGDANPLTFTARIGNHPNPELGTESSFSIPKKVQPSPKAKMVWKAKLQGNSLLSLGRLTFNVTPPADCPVGKYKLLVKYKDVEGPLAEVTVLFNPWCADDSVYLKCEEKRQEYVMNEQGVVYKGSANYIFPQPWDFGQFEDDMVDIALCLLDNSLSYNENPARDVSKRGDPVHVSRVLTHMINCANGEGVLMGNWSGDYEGGFRPSHWCSSHPIFSAWYHNGRQPVKYGQCWVFACVICSVMRLLGIPCRVVTNFASAHDVDRNLSIDTYHCASGLEDRPSPDSVWNFHVWVEGWFKRPDLCSSYDGWQVLDATPQETSGGVYRCGPAPVKAIKKGRTELDYDTPFVFAEVNADCKDWLVFDEDESSAMELFSDSKRVGKKISTKYVGREGRRDVTECYKHLEGTPEERQVFYFATTRDYCRVDEPVPEFEEETDEDDDDDVVPEVPEVPEVPPAPPVTPPPPPEVTMRFEEASQPIDGKDVEMNLVLHSESTVARDLTINFSVQAMRYNGVPAANILNEEVRKTLLPGQELTVPIVVPYSEYHSHMVNSESMRIEVLVKDKDRTYLAEDDIVLLEPAIELITPGNATQFCTSMVEVVFKNPIDAKLTGCVLTLVGSGLLRDEFQCQLPDLNSGQLVRIKVYFRPYKKGKKTLTADFDCSDFRDLKASTTIFVM